MTNRAFASVVLQVKILYRSIEYIVILRNYLFVRMRIVCHISILHMPGKFQNATGQTMCMECPPGTYSADNPSACSVCEAGFFANANGSPSCLPCSEGFECSSRVALPLPGYWTPYWSPPGHQGTWRAYLCPKGFCKGATTLFGEQCSNARDQTSNNTL